MRYLMKQKLFCFGDDFAIKDAAGTDRFFVDGKAFTIGNKLSFQDLNGNELAFIRQKMESIIMGHPYIALVLPPSPSWLLRRVLKLFLSAAVCQL